MVCDSLGFCHLPFSVDSNCFALFQSWRALMCPSQIPQINHLPFWGISVSAGWNSSYTMRLKIFTSSRYSLTSFFLPGLHLIPFLGCPLSSKIFTEDWLKDKKKVLNTLSLLTLFISTICYLLGGRATVFLTHLLIMIWDEVLSAPC